MPGDGQLGEEFRVNFLIHSDGAVTDRGRIVSEGETVEAPAGTFTDVRVIQITNNLQPHLLDRKYYAAGVGLIFEDSPLPETDLVELLSFTIPGE
jgi:hypothetical protein